MRYHPYGAIRYRWGTTPTSYQFTGQRNDGALDEDFGLYYYNARYYDPALGRFIQADTLVPGAGNPQALNRYAYALNNPLKYIDPTGHDLMIVGGVGGDLDAYRWRDWITAYKGWDDQMWTEFYNKYRKLKEDEDFAGQQALLDSIGVRIFSWGGKSMSEGEANAASEWTDEMVDQLASEMKGMQEITLIGLSKGGNLVMHYLDLMEAGVLAADVPHPLHVTLISPATIPLSFLGKAATVKRSVSQDGPQTVNICASGDAICLSRIKNALNVNPPCDHGHTGPPEHFAHGLYASSVLGTLNVQGEHQAYDQYRYR